MGVRIHAMSSCFWILLLLIQGTQETPPPSTASTAPDAGDVHERMERLILKIEKDLRGIDELLVAAGAPRGSSRSEEIVAGSSVREAASQGRRVVEDIDHLLELTFHPHPPGGL